MTSIYQPLYKGLYQDKTHSYTMYFFYLYHTLQSLNDLF